MNKTIGIIQIIISILLITSILLQNKGAGLGETFGGDSNVYQTKRGFDKFLSVSTIVLSVLLFSAAFVSFLQR